MPSLRNLAIAIVLLTAGVAWGAPWTVTEDGKRWEDSTQHMTADGNKSPTANVGHVLVPLHLIGTPKGDLILDGGAVRLKTQGEKDAEAAALAATAEQAAKDSNWSTGVAAGTRLAGLLEWRKALDSAGKSLTQIDDEIQAARDDMTEALKDLP